MVHLVRKALFLSVIVVFIVLMTGCVAYPAYSAGYNGGYAPSYYGGIGYGGPAVYSGRYYGGGGRFYGGGRGFGGWGGGRHFH